jgi:hypothetical protein
VRAVRARGAYRHQHRSRQMFPRYSACLRNSNWPPSLLLPDRCTIRRVPAGGDILDPVSSAFPLLPLTNAIGDQ